ncbi:MAG: hypothetical protein E7375_03590 [Clostridiales bacterium]|nr:hypothetical protein [Clostridiales bacterium]
MKKPQEKNIHEGHRERLLDLVSKVGLENLSPIQAVEVFLTYVFPRGDVNPLAHRLLEEYESFTHIVDADVEDLKRIKGINDRSAKKIALFSDMFYYYTTAKMGRKTKVECIADIVDIVEDHLRFRNTENMLLLAISPGNIVTHKRRINMNDAQKVSISMLELTNFLATSKPASLVVAHCHPYGSSAPSKADEDSLKEIQKLCESCGINLVNSYIVGEDGVYGQLDKRIIREYCDVEQLKTAFTCISNN